MFITFEGPDGCGKSTVLEEVNKELLKFNIETVKTREPGGTPISEKLRQILLDENNKELTDITESLLIAASRSQHVEELIIPNLKENKLVLCDRFVISSLVYQGYARGLGIDCIKKLNEFATKGLRPDIILYFDVSQEGIIKRKNYRNISDRLEKEEVNFHKMVYKGYNYIKERFKDDDNFYTVDANKSIEEVTSQCISIIMDNYRRKK
ncbi:MAG: dTMP kinase [Lagierella massiliensis]|nr:dTMP kinase [Lagierella massiliensis]